MRLQIKCHGGAYEPHDHEKDDSDVGPSADFGVERPFCFHQDIDGAMHHKARDAEESDRKSVGSQEGGKAAFDDAFGIQRHALDEVAQYYADDGGKDEAGGKKADIPKRSPRRALSFAPEFDRSSPQHEAEEHKHKRGVEVGREDGKSLGERGKKYAAADHDPGGIAIPDGADGIDHDAPLLIGFRKEMEAADAEVKAVERGVGDDGDHEHEIHEKLGDKEAIHWVPCKRRGRGVLPLRDRGRF